MKSEKLVMDFARLSLWEVQELDLDVYLYLVREAYIYDLSQTKQGREYLETCKRLTVTKPEREKLRARYGKNRKRAGNGS